MQRLLIQDLAIIALITNSTTFSENDATLFLLLQFCVKPSISIRIAVESNLNSVHTDDSVRVLTVPCVFSFKTISKFIQAIMLISESIITNSVQLRRLALVL